MIKPKKRITMKKLLAVLLLIPTINLAGYFSLEYDVEELIPFGGNQVLALSINPSNQVVGVCSHDYYNVSGFIYNDGQMINLGHMGHQSGYTFAMDINVGGVVVGRSLNFYNKEIAFKLIPENGLWYKDDNFDGANDLMVPLTDPNGETSRASVINGQEKVCGFYGDTYLPVEFVGGDVAYMETVPGFVNYFITDINRDGYVSGYYWDSGANHYPCYWNPNGDIYTISTEKGEAWSINRTGKIAGCIYSGNDQMPVVWLDAINSNDYEELSITGFVKGCAYEINRDGIIVGSCEQYDPWYDRRGVMWENYNTEPIDTQEEVSSYTVFDYTFGINPEGSMICLSEIGLGVKSWVMVPNGEVLFGPGNIQGKNWLEEVKTRTEFQGQ